MRNLFLCYNEKQKMRLAEETMSRKYKVLLIDDEPWILYGMKKLADWGSFSFEVTEEAANGIQALDIIRQGDIDVAFSDIRMPGLDGMQLIEEIHRLKLRTKVVLVSGYAEFSYAKKALLYGVFDYLLKQVKKEDLENVLKRLKSELDKEQKMIGNDNMLEQLSEVLISKSTITAGEFMKFFISDLPFQNYCICHIQYKDPSVIRKIKNDQSVKAVFRIGSNQALILENTDRQGVMTELPLGIKGGYCQTDQGTVSLLEIYQKTEIAFKTALFLNRDSLVEYKEKDQRDIRIFMSSAEQILREKKGNDRKKVLDCYYKLCISGGLFIDQIVVLYNQLATLFYKYYSYKKDSDVWNYLTEEQIFNEFGNIQSFFSFLYGQLQAEEVTEGKTSSQVQHILHIIEHNYAEDIKLADISADYNLSIGHLSNMIKKETGMTFTEHITKKRIEESKKLLTDEKFSVIEVAEKVGYHDYFYFTKLFKKQTGISPSKFRKKSK